MNIEALIEVQLKQIYNDENIFFDKTHFAGGLTNYNYIMNIKGKEYVIRKPGGMTHLMIDRKVEKINNDIVTGLGVNSQCIHFDEETGIKFSKYIKGSKNMGELNPLCRENIMIANDLMKKIHNHTINFPNIFDWEKEINKYESVVLHLNGCLFSDYLEYKNLLREFMKFNIKDVKLVPCHNDTVPENFLVDKEGKGYLIDWEYAGLNDPAWDLAAYIIESKLNKEAIDYLLVDYYGETPSDQEIIKIKSYMMAQDLLWTVWALIRHYNGDDFLDYCMLRYERFKKNMDSIRTSLQYSIENMVREQ